jgi:hypothetical protein
VVLNETGDEKTAFRFTINEEGTILQLIDGKDLPRRLTGEAKPNAGE